MSESTDILADALSRVKPGHIGRPHMSKFWPYKLAAMLIYNEIPGIKKLPGHTILAPMPILHKLCPTTHPRLKGHLNMAVDLGIFKSVEFHYSTAVITVEPTPWETGEEPVEGSVPTHPPRVSTTGMAREDVLREAEEWDPPDNLPVLQADYLANLLKGPDK